MTVRMRHTRAHTANRRSHHKVAGTRLSACGNCGAPHQRHTVCPKCGMYRGKEMVNVAAQAVKKAKRAERKQEMLREQGRAPEGGTVEPSEKEALSKEKE